MLAVAALFCAAVLQFFDIASKPPPPCLCSDPSLCRPLSPQPRQRDEVVAFSSWVFNGEPRPRGNYSAPELFDWSKITVWAPFETEETGHNLEQYGRLFCTAHAHGARVLAWSRVPDGSGSRGCGVTDFYQWARERATDKSSNKMFNKTAIRAWASKTAACIPAAGFDGVLLDQEAIDS